MITNVITIGSNAACDFVINQFTRPTMHSYCFERILPIHAQILEEDNQYYILPFSDYISINGNYINNSSLRKKMVLNIEDRISIGVFDLFWQQWIAGLGLCCDKCKYNRWRQDNDEWCQYCKKCNYDPSPYEYGYNSKFKDDKSFYNYVDCNKCGLKPDWCIECNFQMEPEPKNRSFKEHIDMYLQRLKTYELQTMH